ncbi:N-acetylglucosamine kinase [Nonomuraea dietziae]|uniref:N-acetylglucosamine kinase n=1 Tax=Nonomuraea dietziae TaxID=65515 RepID=UPI00341EFB48
MDLAIDGGQTGLRLALCSRGRVEEIRQAPGLSYAEGSPAKAVLERIGSGWSGLGTICMGLTTLLDDHDALADGLLAMAERVMITTDVVTSHAGAFAGGRGVVLAAGTGAIALGVADTVRQVDGWGYLYGDAGGGFWIGRQGLDAAYRGFDGRAEAGALTERAQAVWGDLAELPGLLYLSPDAVARIARFAVHVFELAERDATARAIVSEAGRELASTVTAAARCFPEDGQVVPVAWTGRLLRDSRLRAAFGAELAARLPLARLRPPAGDSLAGAALLAAADDPGVYDSMIRTVTR